MLTRAQQKSGLFLLILYFLLSGHWFQDVPLAAAEPQHQIFMAIEARPKATVEKWKAKGISDNVAAALAAYETTPSMATAIPVLRHYKYFAAKKNDSLRVQLFQEDPQLFKSLDTARYDLILQTQQQFDDIDHAFRVGSTGQRFKALVDWARKPNRTLDGVPALNPNKQFKSDDDITNVPRKAALKNNPLAGEALNGESARLAFRELTKKRYGEELDPKVMEVEFLSPTSAFKIMQARNPGQYTPHWPDFLAAWVSSDPEKYNGMFGVEQLNQWGMKAGVVTGDLKNPLDSTESYASFKAAHKDRALDSFDEFPTTDLFGWMANNHRQIFQVHGGDLKSLAKYTMRMVDGWKHLGLDPPSDALGMSTDELYELAETIYKPEDEAAMQHVKNIEQTAYDLLFKLNRKLLVEGYKKNISDLTAEIRNNVPARPVNPDDPPDPKAYIQQAMGNKKVQELLNNISLAYTNIDDELVVELRKIVEDDIKAGRPDDVKAPAPDWDSAFKAELSTHMKNMLDDMKSAADSTRPDIEAFRFMRYQIGEQVNAHLDKIGGLNLDDYLVRIAMGNVTETEWRFVGGSPRSVQRQLDPDEICRDLRLLQSMAKNFKWGDAKLAGKVKEYFDGNPSGAVTILKHLHNICNPDKGRRITLKYKDAAGNDVVQSMETTRWQSVRSAGVLAFKGAMKGWKIWGDAASARDLYNSMADIFLNDSLTQEQIAASWAKALTSFVGVAEYAELVNYYGTRNLKVNIPLGSTLGQMTAMADGKYLDPQQQKELTLTFIKDLTIMYVPHLAVANALWGMGTYGYDKWSLSASKAEILDLLVENGEWQFETAPLVDADGKVVLDINGNIIQIPDRGKLPELTGVKFARQGKKNVEIQEVAPVELLKKGKDGKEKRTVRKLAKILDHDIYPDNILLLKSKSHVDPRAALLDLAYRSGTGYIANNQALQVDEDAIRNLIDDVFWQIHIFFTTTRDWTKAWVKKNMGVVPPTREDAVELNRKDQVEVVATYSVPLYFSGIQVGSLKFDWKSWVADGIRKNFGYQVSDYWVKRQRILEDDVLPVVIEEAARRVMEDSMLNQDAVDYLDEIKLIDERVKEIDRRIWPKIERSADPFPVTAKSNGVTTERVYDPENDLPVYDHFRLETKDERDEIKRIIQWLLADSASRGPYLYTVVDSGISGINDMSSSVQVNLGEDEVQVKDRAKEVLKIIIDLMNKYEEAYDKMLTSLESTNGYVSQGDGSPKFSIDAYHVKLRGDLGPVVDTKAVAELDKGYRTEYARVEKDVGNILNVRGWGQMVGLTGVEEFFGDLMGQGFEFYAAKSHPYWGKLLRLRFQIHKLQLVQQNIHQVTRGELERVFADRMILEDKVIDLENPPTALSGQLTGQGDEGASAPPLSATSQDDKDKTPGAHLATVGGRIAFVNQMITLMEGEYKALLSMILNMFDFDLTLEPEAPATSLKVWTVMKVTAAVGVKKDKDGKPLPVKLGKIGPDEVKKAVKNYHWEVWRKDQSGKYIERDTREPEVLLPLFEAGTFLLRVYAQGANSIPLSESMEAFEVEPAEFSANLQINGDFPGHALVQIKADDWMVDAVEVPAMSRDWHQQLKLEVKKAPRPRVSKLDVNDLDNKFYVDFGAWAWVNVPPRDKSKRVVSRISPGLFTVPPDQPLVLNYPYNVDVTVKVVDAGRTKLAKEVEYLVTSGRQQLLFDHGFLKLKKDDVVKARVKYKHPPIILEKDGKDVIFDPADSKAIDFNITLPFFEEDHLLVRGDFVLPADIDPPAQITRGSMRSNLSDDLALSGPHFEFKNSKPILLSKPLNISAVLYSDDGRMFRPVKGIFSTNLKEGKEFSCGQIQLEPYELKVDPIRISVTDQAGVAIPEDQLKVMMESQPVSWDGSVFKGAWTFTREHEEITIEAGFKMPDGSTAKGSHTLSIDDFDLLGVPVCPDITIKIPVYLSLDISGTTKLFVPPGKKKPQNVKIFNTDLGIEEWLAADSGFLVTTKVPVPADMGIKIRLDGVAQATAREGKYEGFGTGRVSASSRQVNVGRIDLKQKGDSFVSINNLALSLGAGISKPVHGQPLEVKGAVKVNNYEGPLALTWKRYSDDNSDIQFKGSVAKGENFTTTYTFPPVVENLRVKDDVIELEVSDGADRQVRKLFPFSWLFGDEFKGFTFVSENTRKGGTSFNLGETIKVTSSWKIVKDMGSGRTIVYSVAGTEFAREDVSVPEGRNWQHTTSLDTKQQQAGRLTVKAELVNLDPAVNSPGSVKLTLKEGEDEIISAGAAAAAGSQAGGKNFTQGDQVYLNAVVKAAEGKDGLRTLTLQYRSKTVLTENFDMESGERINKSFMINTGKLKTGRHVFTLTLLNDNGRQDRKILRFLVDEDKSQQGGGGLQNVDCTGNSITLKVWDHGAQDGDIITLSLGGRNVLSGFNMNACGGSEPSGPPCAFSGLPFPSGSKVQVSIYAHNEGTSSPNTASLKVEGGCTPELQNWNLSTGESASIFISRVKTTPQQQKQGNGGRQSQQSGQSGGSGGQSQAGGSASGQSVVKSWP